MRPKKSLGQHFLRCNWVAQTMLKAADLGPKDTILEIGPGTGILTYELAKKAKKVVAVEKDERLAAELNKNLRRANIANVKIIPGDILKLLESDFRSLRSYKVVANIPYYLTSRLLRLLLESKQKPELIVLTIQKEVAQRIIAKPPKLSLLAFSVQIFGKPEIIKTVPRDCFFPKPSVESAIIKVSGVSDGLFAESGPDSNTPFTIARVLFAKKRKTVLNNLASLTKKINASAILKNAGVNPSKRAQELNVKEILEIAKSWKKIKIS